METQILPHVCTNDLSLYQYDILRLFCPRHQHRKWTLCQALLTLWPEITAYPITHFSTHSICPCRTRRRRRRSIRYPRLRLMHTLEWSRCIRNSSDLSWRALARGTSRSVRPRRTFCISSCREIRNSVSRHVEQRNSNRLENSLFHLAFVAQGMDAGKETP